MRIFFFKKPPTPKKQRNGKLIVSILVSIIPKNFRKKVVWFLKFLFFFFPKIETTIQFFIIFPFFVNFERVGKSGQTEKSNILKMTNIARVVK